MEGAVLNLMYFFFFLPGQFTKYMKFLYISYPDSFPHLSYLLCYRNMQGEMWEVSITSFSRKKI